MLHSSLTETLSVLLQPFLGKSSCCASWRLSKSWDVPSSDLIFALPHGCATSFTLHHGVCSQVSHKTLESLLRCRHITVVNQCMSVSQKSIQEIHCTLARKFENAKQSEPRAITRPVSQISPEPLPSLPVDRGPTYKTMWSPTVYGDSSIRFLWRRSVKPCWLTQFEKLCSLTWRAYYWHSSGTWLPSRVEPQMYHEYIMVIIRTTYVEVHVARLFHAQERCWHFCVILPGVRLQLATYKQDQSMRVTKLSAPLACSLILSMSTNCENEYH